MNEIKADNMLTQMRMMAALAENKTASEVPSSSNVSFSDLMKQAVNTVNTVQQHAEQLSTDYVQGKPGIDLGEVMVASQKSGIAFNTLLQVRNKLLTAYQDIAKMPI